MKTVPMHTFECQMYVPARGPMKFRLPVENGPTQVIRLQPLAYDQLIDPAFRRLLAAFESVPRPLTLQV
jgi:hypothetical protein